MKNTKKLELTMTCLCVYQSSIEVPAELSLEDAINYAKEHINEIPVGNIDGSNYISDSDRIDEENCNFAE